MDSLPPLRDVINDHGLGAKKSLGQHFLLDMNITRKIARIAGITDNDLVIEIGPGPGGLTRPLLETGAHVMVIERDERCIAVMQELSAHYPNQMTIIEADALKVDELDLIDKLDVAYDKLHLVSNLPYNISTELLIKWLTKDQRVEDQSQTDAATEIHPQFWDSMTLMFQKEVGDRILAGPGSKTFGRLGIISQVLSLPKRAFDLPARAFTPPPKIDSTVVHFSRIPPVDFDVKKLEKITAAAFSQRRKMLRSSLKAIFGDATEEVLTNAGIKPTARAEDIAVADFIALAKVA